MWGWTPGADCGILSSKDICAPPLCSVRLGRVRHRILAQGGGPQRSRPDNPKRPKPKRTSPGNSDTTLQRPSHPSQNKSYSQRQLDPEEFNFIPSRTGTNLEQIDLDVIGIPPRKTGPEQTVPSLDRLDRPDRENRLNRSDRTGRFGSFNRENRSDRPDRGDRFDRYDRSDWYDRSDRYDRENRFDRSDRWDRGNKVDNVRGKRNRNEAVRPLGNLLPDEDQILNPDWSESSENREEKKSGQELDRHVKDLVNELGTDQDAVFDTFEIDAQPFDQDRGKQKDSWKPRLQPANLPERVEKKQKKHKKSRDPRFVKFKSSLGTSNKLGAPVPPPFIRAPLFDPTEVLNTPPDSSTALSTADQEDGKLHYSPPKSTVVLPVEEAGVIHGVNLSELESWIEHRKFVVKRDGTSKAFSEGLPQDVELSVAITNDYYECEKWAESVMQKRVRMLGCQMFHGFLREPMPVPRGTDRAKRKYRRENRPPAPPPIPPEGPLKLRETGSVIVLMALSAGEDILLVQLHQMQLIGPKFRALLGNPLIRKGGQHVGLHSVTLRVDGVPLIGGEEIYQVFYKNIQVHHVRDRIREVLARAGFGVFTKSISGVDLNEPDAEPYIWGEKDLTEEMIEFAARKSYGCHVMLSLLSEIKPEDMPAFGPVEPARDPEEKEALEKYYNGLE